MNGTALIPYDATAASRRPMVFVQNGEVFANSLDVAAFFDKHHHHVLRDLDGLCQLEPELRSREFTEASYTVGETKNGFSVRFNELAANRTYRCIHMTRDGFMLLAMGFGGSKALKLKRAYIAGFNNMERELLAERLKETAPAPLDLRNPQTLAGLLTKLIPIAQEQAAVIERQAAQIAVAAPKVEAFDALVASEGLFVLSDAAKAMDWKPREFIRELARRGFLFKRQQSWIAKQVWIDAGWFKVRTKQYEHWTSSQTFVTPKGLDALRRKLNEKSAAQAALAFVSAGNLFSGRAS